MKTDDRNNLLGNQAEDNSVKNFVMLTDTTLNNTPYINNKDIQTEITGDTPIATFEEGTTVFTINNYDKLKEKGTPGVLTDKLLKALVTQFTIQHPKEKIEKIKEKSELPNLEVNIPLKQYLHNLGQDISTEKAFYTAVERNIEPQLDILYNLDCRTIEEIKGKKYLDANVRIIDKKAIYYQTDRISVRFTIDFANSLLRAPRYTTRPYSQLAIDPRNPTLYRLYEVLYSHYSQKKNKDTNRNNRLKVSTILQKGIYPDYNSNTVKKRGWRGAICDPIERDLQEMWNKKDILDWYYCHPGGKKLTNKEQYDLYKNYEIWSTALIHFELNM